MTDFINTLQANQKNAIEHGMSFTLDVINSPEEVIAKVTIRSAVSNGAVDDQRYMKTSISSEEEPTFITTKLNCISDFISQVSTSENYNQE